MVPTVDSSDLPLEVLETETCRFRGFLLDDAPAEVLGYPQKGSDSHDFQHPGDINSTHPSNESKVLLATFSPNRIHKINN